MLASSGTGAMEGAVVNTLCAEDKALVVQSGKFGERWAQICNAYGVHAKIIHVEWGKAVDPDLIKKALEVEPSIKAVFMQASETSTGVMHPVKEIAEIVGISETNTGVKINRIKSQILKNIQNMYIPGHKFYVTFMWLEENPEKES